MKNNRIIALFIVSCALPIFGMNKELDQNESRIFTRQRIIRNHMTELLSIDPRFFHSCTYSGTSVPVICDEVPKRDYSGFSVSRIEAHLRCWEDEGSMINDFFVRDNYPAQLSLFSTERPRTNRCIAEKSRIFQLSIKK